MTAPSKASFSVTAEHLARMMETARQKERARIAALLDQKAAEALGAPSDTTDAVPGAVFNALTTIAEELRGGAGERIAPAASIPAGVPPVPVRDPLLTDIDSEVAAEEHGGGDGLPPVRHHDDFAEGQALARAHGFRQ